MNSEWPEWPKDQVKLPDLGIDPPQTRQDPVNPRIKEPTFIHRGKRECPVCGRPKTIGMPCDHGENE